MQDKEYHRLLMRQIRRFVRPELVEELTPLFENVSEFYVNAENERRLLEHTLDVNSKELEEANRSLKRHHEELHNSILSALSIGLFAVDNGGRIVFANENAAFIFGRTVDELIGVKVGKLIEDPEIRLIIEFGVGTGRKEGFASVDDVHGHTLPIRYSAYQMLQDGLPNGIVFSIADITLDQKRDELIDLQQLALESTTTMMVIADKDGHIQYANKEFVRVSGYELEELIGENSSYILDYTLNSPKMVQECWGRVSNGLVWEGEVRSKTKSGEIYFEELSITPLIQKGQITHFVAVKKDIGERLRNQEELKMARDHAIEAMHRSTEANRAKDVFLSNMSHELRTPLNAIIGFSQILMKKKDTPAGVHTFIEKILISGQNLLSLVNTILDFSKIESGKMEIHKKRFPVEDLIHELKILIEPMAEKKGLVLTFVIPEEVSVTADRQLLKQALVNLLSNAVKFSPPNETIRFRCRVENGQNRFSIEDHGPGIPKENIDSLFDPFVQIREHQHDAVKGTGLGLSIVKKIIELHEGSIGVESTLGEGSCFWFTIPL
ncbi:MAG: PAS domain-containing sensor histidine kinase [Sulfuricurvum sp.]